MTPAPTPPAVPTSWTPVTITMFVFAAVGFLISSLVSGGVIAPALGAHLSSTVQLWSGLVGNAVSLAVAVIAGLSHHSVVKAHLKAAAGR